MQFISNALLKGKIDVLKYMINEVGVDPVARDSSGMSTTHAAAMGHQLETVKVTHWLITSHDCCTLLY